jgi:hypothetical protein
MYHKLRFILSRNLSDIFLRHLMYHSYCFCILCVSS